MKEKRKTYLKGLLGAVLGALAGVVAWVLVAHFVGGNLHLSFGFVLALLTYIGYTGMGGKLGKGTYAIYIGVVLVFGFIAFILSIAISALNNFGLLEPGNFQSVLDGGQYGNSGIGVFFNMLSLALTSVFQSLPMLWTDLAISVIFEMAGGGYFLLKIHDQRKLARAEEDREKEGAPEEDEEFSQPDEEEVLSEEPLEEDEVSADEDEGPADEDEI